MALLSALWEQFLKEGGEPDTTSFGVWLIRQPHQTPLQVQRATSITSLPDTVDSDTMAAILVGRLERFAHFASKQAFKNAGINNPDEFPLLATLFFMGKTGKTQLLKQSLMEITTGSQMLKRMLEDGLLLEKPNPEDARSQWITLSAKGKKMLFECFAQLGTIEEIMSGLEPQDKQHLLRILDQLDSVHSKRHQIKTAMEVIQESQNT